MREAKTEALVALPPTKRKLAFRRVAERLQRAAADPASRWSPAAKADAMRIAAEFLAQVDADHVRRETPRR